MLRTSRFTEKVRMTSALLELKMVTDLMECSDASRRICDIVKRSLCSGGGGLRKREMPRLNPQPWPSLKSLTDSKPTTQLKHSPSSDSAPATLAEGDPVDGKVTNFPCVKATSSSERDDLFA